MSLKDQFSSRTILANEVKISSASTYGTLTVGTVATQITGGSTETSLFVQAHKDIADVVYLGLDNTVNFNNHFASLTAGEKLEIIMDVSDPVTIFAIGTNTNDKVCFLEGVN